MKQIYEKIRIYPIIKTKNLVLARGKKLGRESHWRIFSAQNRTYWRSNR